MYQNLATLTKGNTPMPRVLLLGGPNLFFQGLREAWTHHLAKLWEERKVALPEGTTPEDVIMVPEDALYYAALGCIELGRRESERRRRVRGRRSCAGGSRRASTRRRRRRAARVCGRSPRSWSASGGVHRPSPPPRGVGARRSSWDATSDRPPPRPSASTPEGEILHSCYALSKGNPIEDAKALFRQVREAAGRRRGGGPRRSPATARTC